MKSHTLEEMMAILTAGGRSSGEQSRALPRHAYGDPANHVEFPAEAERRRKLREAKKLKKLQYRAKGK